MSAGTFGPWAGVHVKERWLIGDGGINRKNVAPEDFYLPHWRLLSPGKVLWGS